MGGPAPSRLSVPDSARYHNSVFISTSVEAGSETGDCVYRPWSPPHCSVLTMVVYTPLYRHSVHAGIPYLPLLLNIT